MVSHPDGRVKGLCPSTCELMPSMALSLQLPALLLSQRPSELWALCKAKCGFLIAPVSRVGLEDDEGEDLACIWSEQSMC